MSFTSLSIASQLVIVYGTSFAVGCFIGAMILKKTKLKLKLTTLPKSLKIFFSYLPVAVLGFSLGYIMGWLLDWFISR